MAATTMSDDEAAIADGSASKCAVARGCSCEATEQWLAGLVASSGLKRLLEV